MPDEPVAEDAADGFLTSDVLVFRREFIDRAQIRLLNTKHNPIAFDARTAS